jgi:RecA/RadA recombinase
MPQFKFKGKFAKNLAAQHILVPHLDQYFSTEVSDFVFRLEPKEKDFAWHPSGDCTPPVTELYHMALDRQAGVGRSEERRVRGADSLGLVSAVIAVEPNWEDEWAEKNGVNLDTTVVMYPDTLEEAFGMLRDIVYDNDADFILFDSLGGGTTDKAIASDTKQAYGNSGIITWGVQRVVTRMKKNNITVLYTNQVRQHSSQNATWHESPGGEALKHAMTVRIHAKPGSKKFNATVHGEKIMVGREIHAVVKTAGVLKGDGWIYHDAFPGGKINGAPKTGAFLLENPEVYKQIREETLAVMDAKADAAEEKRTKLKVVENG